VTDSSTSTLLIRHRIVVLLVLGFLIYVPFLGMRDMWYPDEPDIAEISKAMYESGDWVAPRRMGTIFVDYPPMIYWVGAVSAHAFGGMTEFGLRLPNALAAIALVLLTCAVASRWFDPRTGLWAGVMLLTFQQYALQAVGYRPDVLFSLFITAGIFAYLHGAGERPRLGWRVAAFACFGLAMLSKGPLGLLLPGLILTLWLGRKRQWLRILEMAPLSLVALAVYLPWFVACARAMGADSILYELYAQNIARFLAGARGHEKPFWYFLTNIWGDLVPWSPLLPFALWYVWRTKMWKDRKVELLLWWFGTFFVFLSIAVTKRQLYLLPAYPAIAMLMAPWVAAVTTPEKKPEDRPDPRPANFLAVAFGILYAFLGVVALVAVASWDSVLARLDLNEVALSAALAVRWPLGLTGIVLLAGAVWLFLAGLRRDARTSLVRIGVVHVVLYVVLLAIVLPVMNPVKTYRPVGEWIAENTDPDQRFGLVDPGLGFHKMGGMGYYSGRLIRLMETPEEVERFFVDYPGSVVLIDEEYVDGIFAGNEPVWRGRVVHELQTRSDTYIVVSVP
jgi:4-amino-4-deoxy-L-arabinose transferase-like glycosyltransferase